MRRRQRRKNARKDADRKLRLLILALAQKGALWGKDKRAIGQRAEFLLYIADVIHVRVKGESMLPGFKWVCGKDGVVLARAPLARQ